MQAIRSDPEKLLWHGGRPHMGPGSRSLWTTLRVARGSLGRDDNSQCRKWRTPVNTIAMPWASAASITSLSRTEPPGWMTAVAPASMQASMPSANGKNASDATAEPLVSGSGKLQFARGILRLARGDPR